MSRLPSPRLTAQSSPVRDLLALTGRPEVISFAGGLPAPELLDADGMREAMAEVLAGAGAQRALQYGPSEGDPTLRTELAALLARRGVDGCADDVLVTSGSQQALSLIATTLLQPGDRVLVESPTYLAALQAFQIAGAELVSWSATRMDRGPTRWPRRSPSTSRGSSTWCPHSRTRRDTRSRSRRRALADVLADAPVWLVEDDPYRELRYCGEHVDAIAADPRLRDRVLLLATLSKVVAPGLRIGWMTTPEPLRRALVIAKQATDLHTSGLTQAAAAHWLQRGRLEPQLERLVAAYRERRDVAAEDLADALPAGAPSRSPREECSSGRPSLRVGCSGAAARGARRTGCVRARRGVYAGRVRRPHARLSFTTHTPAQLREGMARLARAADQASTAR